MTKDQGLKQLFKWIRKTKLKVFQHLFNKITDFQLVIGKYEVRLM